MLPCLPATDKAAQLQGILLYAAAFAIAVLGWGFNAINAAFPDEPAQSIGQFVLKLATMVVLPAWLFLHLRLGMRATLPPRRLWLIFIVMSLAYLALQGLIGRGLATLQDLAPSAVTLAVGTACLLAVADDRSRLMRGAPVPPHPPGEARRGQRIARGGGSLGVVIFRPSPRTWSVAAR